MPSAWVDGSAVLQVSGTPAAGYYAPTSFSPLPVLPASPPPPPEQALNLSEAPFAPEDCEGSTRSTEPPSSSGGEIRGSGSLSRSNTTSHATRYIIEAIIANIRAQHDVEEAEVPMPLAVPAEHEELLPEHAERGVKGRSVSVEARAGSRPQDLPHVMTEDGEPMLNPGSFLHVCLA